MTPQRRAEFAHTTFSELLSARAYDINSTSQIRELVDIAFAAADRFINLAASPGREEDATPPETTTEKGLLLSGQ